MTENIFYNFESRIIYQYNKVSIPNWDTLWSLMSRLYSYTVKAGQNLLSIQQYYFQWYDYVTENFLCKCKFYEHSNPDNHKTQYIYTPT